MILKLMRNWKRGRLHRLRLSNKLSSSTGKCNEGATSTDVMPESNADPEPGKCVEACGAETDDEC
jgi:hypothetical protein